VVVTEAGVAVVPPAAVVPKVGVVVEPHGGASRG
jgi:hypothetical protein